jgi:hypothetical protein
MSPADPRVEVVFLKGTREVTLPFKRALTSGELPCSPCIVQGFEVYAPKGTRLSPEEEYRIQEAILDLIREEAQGHCTVSGLRSWLHSSNGSIRLNGRNLYWKKDSLQVLPL